MWGRTQQAVNPTKLMLEENEIQENIQETNMFVRTFFFLSFSASTFDSDIKFKRKFERIIKDTKPFLFAPRRMCFFLLSWFIKRRAAHQITKIYVCQVLLKWKKKKKIQAPSGLTECFGQSGLNSCLKMTADKSTAEGNFGKYVAPNSKILISCTLHVRSGRRQLH